MKLLKRMLFATVFLLAACGGCESDDDFDPFFEPDEFGTFEFVADPDIDGPDRLDFGDLDQGERAERDILLQNVGRERLKISDWSISSEFNLSFPDSGQAPEELMPGERIAVRISYIARTLRDTRGELVIESNDPDEPRHTVFLSANAKIPCLQLIPSPEMSFGGADPGTSIGRGIDAVNCSDNAETTFVAEIEGDREFALDPSVARQEFTLQPGEIRRLPITFTPTDTGEYSAELVALSDDEFNPEQRVTLTGRGNTGPCPEAVITATNMEQGRFVADPEGLYTGLPLDQVALSGADSRAQGSRIVEYQWSLVAKPTDSGTQLTDNGNDRGLWLDLAGEYVVELNVIDEEGVEACSPARMRLRATANEDIHIQLVWTTPADPNEIDSNGSDVDLHLMHPLGEWNERPYDCFWRNLSPDWGTPRRFENGTQIGAEDDPSLDIDDVDGWGPENINLDNPEMNTTYDVGVHYFSDHAYSVSYATVRIYIGGILFQEFRRQRMIDQEFWHVATIDWPGGEVRAVGQKYPTFPR